jgi:hypothetical protein
MRQRIKTRTCARAGIDDLATAVPNKEDGTNWFEMKLNHQYIKFRNKLTLLYAVAELMDRLSNALT